MSTDISSPLTTKSSRPDRSDRVFQRSEYKFKLPSHGTAPNFPLTNGQLFKFGLLKHSIAPNISFMFKLPRPSLPYHHSAHRQVSLQLPHSGQICRPWRRLFASQHVCVNVSPAADACAARFTVQRETGRYERGINKLPLWKIRLLFCHLSHFMTCWNVV
jgi:hypothetical protein